MQIGEGINVAVITTKDKESKVKPTITANWARPRIRPDHNRWRFPPSSPPTDTTSYDSKAHMRVKVSNVPDGTSAKITVYHCHTGAKLKDGEITGLKVRAGRVIDPATARMPYFVFEDKHTLWDPWDKPFYYFKVEVDHEGLKFETPKDYKGKPKKVLRLCYWHMCVSDAIADTPQGGGLSTQDEMREISTILRREKHHFARRRAFNVHNLPVSHWGSVLRNTYAYHHAGHGDIYDPAGNPLRLPGNPNPPPKQAGTWNSKIALGVTAAVSGTLFGAAEVNQKANIPSVPKYLVYLNICVAGWETSLGKAFTSRGTQNYIAFRMYIPDTAARAMARQFYNKWAGTHKCDPDRIAQVFYDVGSAYYSSMRPVLIGKGGGQISSVNAMNSINSTLSGFSADISSLFK